MQIFRRRAAIATPPVAAPAAPTVMRRSRPGAVQAVAAAPSAPIRNLRFANSSNAVAREAAAAAAKVEIDERLQLIATCELELDEIDVRLQSEHKEIEALLRKHNLSHVSNGKYEAEIKENFSRQSQTIDPKKFKHAVRDADFWKAVTVPIGAAKEVMSAKELAAISDVVPAKSMGYVYKCKKIERKTK